MRIGLCQITAGTDPTANLDLVARAAAEVAARGARIALFPEATMAAFGTDLRAVAEPLDGPWARKVRSIADEHDLVVVAGMFRPAGGGRVWNTTLVTGSGQHRGYDKIHLYDAYGYRESDRIARGTAPALIEVDGVRFGLATCYDLRFPWLFDLLAKAGARAFLVGASWAAGPGKRAQWELLTRARALDTTSWLVACGHSPPAHTGSRDASPVPAGIGRSVVVDPYGRVRAELGAEPGTAIADLDLDLVERARADLPVLRAHPCPATPSPVSLKGE
ncbi:carbon-nitrogen hydrolase family protein [Amycolatopsis viridis]|uniref:Amidohydrolase n=1 Tax=Amycolatopsis viridis TaxID=185678 RepID=A0ABX0SSZ5_9PSEU|nr:carbon-nitrogen hydrolase family protein [Amycolatopsis viridis]NIH78471.1 putative amidohydrolase [Amycolatopsis viridis]